MKPMADTVRKLEGHFTYGDYRGWPDEERWELSGKLFLEIGIYLKGKPCKVFDAPFDVLLPRMDETDDEVETVVQPDISVFCDKSKITKRGARGAPDWVIEILSAHTAKKDYEAKHRLYQRHGVREYWIVDPDATVIHAWRLGEDGIFGEETIYEDGEAALFGTGRPRHRYEGALRGLGLKRTGGVERKTRPRPSACLSGQSTSRRRALVFAACGRMPKAAGRDSETKPGWGHISRNPLLVLRFAMARGCANSPRVFRLADRRFAASLFHEPSRRTRLSPEYRRLRRSPDASAQAIDFRTGTFPPLERRGQILL
jgi:hypothetical protein